MLLTDEGTDRWSHLTSLSQKETELEANSHNLTLVGLPNDYILLPLGAHRDSKPAMGAKHGLEELKSVSKHTP